MFGINDNRNDANNSRTPTPDPAGSNIHPDPMTSPTHPGSQPPMPYPPMPAPAPAPAPGGAASDPLPSGVTVGPAQGGTFSDTPASEPPELGQEASSDDTPSTASPDDLLDIKHQALQSLAPLVSHLDQTPEEKFKTTMMLIQASDNAELLDEAYTIANQIEDEKIRAQALLDVVNEINYFTQKTEQPSSS
jgi:hypothetical protein